MLEYILYLILTALVGIITGLVVYARWNYGKLEKIKGIPVVEPSFILGSYPNLHKLIVHDEDTANFRKYGAIWGVYEGRDPHIYVADPDIVRQIFIKDFDHFHDKRMADFSHPLVREMMDLLPGEKWKVVRNFCTPTLTTGKIRTMSYQMLESINELFEHFKTTIKADSQEFDIKKLYSCLTTDVVAKCAFGTKVSAISEPDNVFVRMVRRLNGDEEDVNFLLAVVQTFPFIENLTPFIPPDVLEFFAKVIGDILKARRKGGVRHNDFIDLLNDMLDNTTSNPKYKSLEISETTVMAQAIVFLFAGFDTTATTLTMLSYRLANNPAKQKKLIEEIDAYLKKNDGKIEHETLGELTYLHACMNESLRMCSPAIRVERVCQKDWSYEAAGLHFKKGQVVQIPIYAIHSDPNNFPDPEVFQPERFLPENKDRLNQYAFMAFGQGPHNCIGMRFAQEEVKLTIATILKDYYFETCEKTTLKFKPGRTFLLQYEPVILKITRRKK